jgi:hypothetical protein
VSWQCRRTVSDTSVHSSPMRTNVLHGQSMVQTAVSTRTPLDSISRVLPIPISRWEMHTYCHALCSNYTRGLDCHSFDTTRDHTLQFTAHTLSVLSRHLHQSFVTGFQRRTFPFLRVPELFPCLSHSNSRVTSNATLPTQVSLPVCLGVRHPSGKCDQFCFL